MSKRIYILVHQQARDRAANDCLTAEQGWVVTIAQPKRNSDQNALLHSLLGEIAERREWLGKKWSVDVWKRLLVSAWMRAEGRQLMILPAIDGHGVDAIYQRTSELTKQECSSLIDYIHAWDAEQ